MASSPPLLSCKSKNFKQPVKLWHTFFFCLWSWRVPAKDDFIQTFCDKDLGKHRILFTQVVVNNMSHQSCIYDKWQSYPHKANLLIIGRKTEYRFTQTVHTGSEAGSSHWNGPRLRFHELNRKQAASTKLHQYVIENKQTM